MESKRKTFQPYIHWIATFGVFVLMMQMGIHCGWVSPNIVRLTAEDSDIPLTKNEASWIAALPAMTAIITGISIGPLSVEFMGSRCAVLLSLVAASLSAICLILANSVLWLYIARVFSGILFATSTGCFSLYLGEVARPKIRGTLISIAASGTAFGMIVGTIMETYLPMKLSSSIYLALCVLSIALLIWLMDSPYYLVKKGNFALARKSVAFYFHNCDVDKELQNVENFVETSISNGFWDKLRNFKSPVVRKSMFLILTVCALPQLSGTQVIGSYMESILVDGKSSVIKPSEFVIYANITNVMTSFFTFRLMDKLGRRILLIFSSLGTMIALVGLGTHFYLISNGYDSSQWLPVICILAYLVMYSCGLATVPSTILSEIVTDNLKSIASCLAVLSIAFFAFVLTKSYQPMVDAFGHALVFWILAGLSSFAIPYSLFILPETKGKSFQEIQDILLKK